MIVTEHTVEARQDADRIHRLLASLRMGRQPGQAVIRRAMQPVTFTADVDACFIGVYQRRLGQTVLDPRLESGGLVESVLIEIEQQICAQRDAGLVFEGLALSAAKILETGVKTLSRTF